MLNGMSRERNNPNDTESRILQAAEREFFAEAAGVTHAMLHYYFRTKDKLFERIVSEKISILGNIIISAIGDEDLTLEDRIRQGIERHFDFIAANRDLPKFIVNEVLTRPDTIDMMKRNAQNIVNNLLNSLQQEIDAYAAKGPMLPKDFAVRSMHECCLLTLCRLMCSRSWQHR